VDYQPADPGCSSHYCERTERLLKDLKVGQGVGYNDPSGILPSIRLVGIDEKGVTLQAGGTTVRLPDFWGSHFSKLAEAGRDYTNFQLYAGLVEDIDITHDLTFLRRFYNANQVAMLPENDVEVLRDSDDPYAKYAYARWLVVQNPKKGSLAKAYKLFKEAAEGGCADALMGLSCMYDNGNAGVVDKMLAVSLRDEALAKGSEWAALSYARNRIFGNNAEAEPEKVIEEVGQRIATETDPYPGLQCVGH